MRILITPRSLTAAGLENVRELEPLRALGYELIPGPAGRLPSEDELVALVPGAEAWLAGVEPISARVLDVASSLTVISRNGVGADAIDLQAAEANGIEILLARGANSRGVAELTMLLILATLRDLPRANTNMKNEIWQRTLGREMPDITIGLIGFGAIGRLVAQLANAFGSTVLAHDAYTEVDAASGATSASLREVFEQSHIVSLHSPPAADGAPIITAEVLKWMMPHSILINTARSSLVDEVAVLNALHDNHLAAYAVDAFDTEPPELTELLRHPNTLLSPHLGGFTTASTRRATELAVSNLVTRLNP
jgi:D-3-phosphoglycerate dehydrogenase